MFDTESEVFEFLEEQDVKFLCLAFCDPYGTMKNATIMTSDLGRAFSAGISIDASAIPGFGAIHDSDLILHPVISTLTVLPWRPAQGRIARIYCSITRPDGAPFEMDSRLILQRAVDHARQMQVTCSFGAECEFYLFKLDESGNPTDEPADHAGYMDVAPFDCGSIVRREICVALEKMDFAPETAHHEEGPGQNEIDFRYGDPMTSADHVLTFKSVVGTVAAANGFHANFRPKPLPEEPGNGFHINMSPRRLGHPEPDPELKRYFMAGILEHIREITVFLNPTDESYRRLGRLKAPKYITWSPMDRSQLIRIPAAKGEYDRIELRSADCMTNPYLVYALLLEAGLDGIRKQLIPPDPVKWNMYELPAGESRGLTMLPTSLAEAVREAEESEFVRRILPKHALAAYGLRWEDCPLAGEGK